jgi:hypothetical protein
MAIRSKSRIMKHSASRVASERNGEPSTAALPDDVREAFIAATVDALLLDLQQFPDLMVGSPRGLDRSKDVA